MTEDHPPTTFVRVDVDGACTDVRIAGGRVHQVGNSLPRAGTRVVDAGGGALLPGLHDHHLHLLAMAARDRSLDLGGVTGVAGFDDAVRDAHAGRRCGVGELGATCHHDVLGKVP